MFFFERPANGRPLKTPQLQAQHHFPAQIIATSSIYVAESGAGEERRRAFEHVAVTSDEGNAVDGVEPLQGAFSAACLRCGLEGPVNRKAAPAGIIKRPGLPLWCEVYTNACYLAYFAISDFAGFSIHGSWSILNLSAIFFPVAFASACV